MFKIKYHTKGLFALLTILALTPRAAGAHVAYVLGHERTESLLGTDFKLLLSPLFETETYLIIIGAALAVAGAHYLITHNPLFYRRYPQFLRTTQTYGTYIPWILRLSIGLALIGSGVGNNLISPALTGSNFFGFIQLLVGFCLLAGFLTWAAALAAIALYIIGLSQNWYLIGNLDFFAECLALLILANPKPGIDDLFGIRFPATLARLRGYAPYFIRISTGLAFISLALYEKLLNPHLAQEVITFYHLTSAVPVNVPLWILSAGLVELAIGIALLRCFHVRFVSAVTFLVLVLSFFYFKEEVYSHVTLFGALSILFITEGKDPEE